MAEPTSPGRSAALPGLFSSASVMSLPVGPALDADGLGGYHIDMRVKAGDPSWPPGWLSPRPSRLWVASVQFGLGAYERWLAGDGDVWLETARACADDLVDAQREDGAWAHGYDYPHTFALPAGWISSITQGEAASFLVRIHAATGDERYVEPARAALRPMTVPTDRGGCLTRLGGAPFPEEYPTDPPSYVLNGGMFAVWGFRDVAVALDDADARGWWDAMAATLRDNLRRWDVGWWSRYDLFGHPVPNLASSFYHHLHVAQLRAMGQLTGEAAFSDTAQRWQGYADSRVSGGRAFVAKAIFRLAVPRNRALARRMPRLRRG